MAGNRGQSCYTRLVPDPRPTKSAQKPHNSNRPSTHPDVCALAKAHKEPPQRKNQSKVLCVVNVHQRPRASPECHYCTTLARTAILVEASPGRRGNIHPGRQTPLPPQKRCRPPVAIFSKRQAYMFHKWSVVIAHTPPRRRAVGSSLLCLRLCTFANNGLHPYECDLALLSHGPCRFNQSWALLFLFPFPFMGHFELSFEVPPV